MMFGGQHAQENHSQDLSVRYRRRSVPLLGMLAAFGLELGGWAGARLAGFTTSGYYPSSALTTAQGTISGVQQVSGG
jgi:hypothetical protein